MESDVNAVIARRSGSGGQLVGGRDHQISGPAGTKTSILEAIALRGKALE